jgi:2',3'-cyclic-nucleotide 2'-phosphodiesterase
VKILMVGDIVGSPGRAAFNVWAEHFLRAEGVDFIVANAENAAAGRGPTPAIAAELMAMGADVLTLGDHAWDSREMVAGIAAESRILRPANLPPQTPGRGWVTVETVEGPLSVVSLQGRVFMHPIDCPFRAVDALLKAELKESAAVLVDFHAEATSEKLAMGRYLDGRVAAVCGTHTHVQTSDERMLPGGTAYITDLGMTGPRDSVLGRDIDAVIEKFTGGLPQKLEVAKKPPVLEGVLLKVNMQNGHAEAIERVRVGAGIDD